MNILNREKQIQQWIRTTMEAVSMNVELIHRSTGVNMSYNFIHNHVGVDIQRVQRAHKEMQSRISLEIYVKALTLHELGHALDRNALLDSLPRTIEIYEMKKSHSIQEQYQDLELLAIRIEEHEMNIRFEKTAWSNAAELNSQFELVSWKQFKEVKAASLATYQKLHDQDAQLYSKLLAAQTEQIA